MGKADTSWEDGSPFTFQAWYSPSPSEMSSQLILRHVGISRLEDTILHTPDHSDIEPVANSTMECTAVIRLSSALTSMRWIKIPCDTQHRDASYICKSNRLNMTESFSKLMPQIIRSYEECATKHFKLGGLCVYIYTVKLPLTGFYNAEKLCNDKQMQVFYLPEYISSKSVTLWTSEEQFTANTLVAMNHRWPSLLDYEVLDSKFVDKLLISISLNESRSGHATLHHSKTSFSHFEVSHFDLNTMSGSLHVACQSVENLTDQTCLSGHYSCDDGTCILSHYACDGIIDCPDSSDESNCNHVCVFTNSTHGDVLDCLIECFPANCTCHDLYFHCPAAGCVPWSRVCDGTPDCPGQEDEVKCHFIVGSQDTPVRVIQRSVGLEIEANETVTTYTCSDGPVISQSRVSDLIPDCPSQDDEILYAEFVRNGSSVTHFNDTVLCDDPEETTCENNFLSVCYPRYLHCVYDSVGHVTKTCRKGSHLKSCKHHSCPSHFKCPNTYCVPTHVLCNGRLDCPNGEDEINCNIISCPGYLLCRHDRLCVHHYDVWNRHVKCPQSQNDKALASYIPCPLECHCLGNAILCNGRSMQSIDEIRLLLKKKLRVDARILVIRNINVTLGDSIWEEAESVFLIHLEISNASLSFIQKEHFTKLAFVRTLNLSHNFIIVLSRGAFNKLQKLEVIDLSYNLISMLNASTFFGLNFLQFIAIRNNNLRFIEACTFAGLSNIETIHLSANKISSFQDFLFCQTTKSSLRNLDLSANPLHHLSVRSLITGLHNVYFLNTTPTSLCCFLPNVEHCFPNQKFEVSSCKHLISNILLRLVFWTVGFVLVLVLAVQAVLTIKQINTTENKKNITNVLTLISLSSGWCRGYCFLTISVVDRIFANWYSLYYKMWQTHPICILTNVISYAAFNLDLFVTLALASTRMIAVVFPFRAVDISLRAVLAASAVFFVLSLTVACLPYAIYTHFSGSVDVVSSLGMLLLLPSVDNWHWSVATVLCPIAVQILIFVTVNILTWHSLHASMRRFEAHAERRKRYKHGIKITMVTLILTLCGYVPFWSVHAITISGFSMSKLAAVTTVTFSLSVIPIVNWFLYLEVALRKRVVK